MEEAGYTSNEEELETEASLAIRETPLKSLDSSATSNERSSDKKEFRTKAALAAALAIATSDLEKVVQFVRPPTFSTVINGWPN